MEQQKVLVSLHEGYGLGDAAQMNAVLRHLPKHRPHWSVDYRAEEGKHQVGRGIVTNTFSFKEPYPSDHYDLEVQIVLYGKWYGWKDRPNTLAVSCLHERFGIDWNPECGRQRIEVNQRAELMARMLLPHNGFVAIHYDGTTAQDKKNLTHEQVDRICRHVGVLGYTPIILDWKYRCPLTNHYRLRAPSEWGGNAEMVCAVINRCRAFVGIDSGPAKCASATDVPSLVVWTGHHPAQFHDPSPNTTHLVPVGYHSLEPVRNDPGVVEWFERHYNYRFYASDPVGTVKQWLSEVLG